VLYRTLLYLRTTVFNAGYYGSGILFGGLSTLIWPLLPYRWRYPLINRWNRFVMVWLRLCCNIRVEVQGDKRADLQPYVVMAKHQSTWETLFLQFYFEPIATILKKELLRIPFFGWGLAALRPIAIDRSNRTQALRDVKTKSVAALKDGINVMVFPEGTRTRPGQTLSYARSGADIACTTGRPIIPIAHNAADCWPHKHYLKYPGTVTIVVGEPIFSEGRDRKVLTEEVRQWIEATMASLPQGRKNPHNP